jgi:hypothetical protein
LPNKHKDAKKFMNDENVDSQIKHALVKINHLGIEITTRRNDFKGSFYQTSEVFSLTYGNYEHLDFIDPLNSVINCTFYYNSDYRNPIGEKATYCWILLFPLIFHVIFYLLHYYVTNLIITIKSYVAIIKEHFEYNDHLIINYEIKYRTIANITEDAVNLIDLLYLTCLQFKSTYKKFKLNNYLINVFMLLIDFVFLVSWILVFFLCINN